MSSKKSPSKPIQSVVRALDILEQFSIEENDLKLSQIAERVGLKRTTCYGLAETLLSKGYLSFDPIKRSYRLGVKTCTMGQIFLQSVDLRQISRSYMIRLSSQYGCVSHLVIPDGIDGIYIEKIGETNSFIVRSNVGKRADRFHSSVSKIILSHLSEKDLDSLLEKPIEPLTSKSITDRDIYKSIINQVRENNIAKDLEEVDVGLICIAAPLYNHLGNLVGVISLSGPSNNMLPHLNEDIANNLKAAAKNISLHLGGVK